MEALPIAPAMMAPPATPAQGSGTTETNFQQELDGQTAARANAAAEKPGNAGSSQNSLVTNIADESTTAVISPAGSQEQQVSELTGKIEDRQTTDPTTGTEITDNSQADATALLLLTAIQIDSVPLSPALTLEAVSSPEGQVPVDSGVVPQTGSPGQVVLQVQENLLNRTNTSAALTAATQNLAQATVTTTPDVPATPTAATQNLAQPTVTTTSATPATPTTETQYSAQATVTTTSATPATPTSTNLSEQTTAAVAQGQDTTAPVGRNTVDSRGAASATTDRTVKILAVTQSTLQTTAPLLSQETESQLTTTSPPLPQDVTVHTLQTPLTSTGLMEETENNAAQPGTDGKSSSQDHDGIVAPNQNLTTTETTGSQDNGSLFSSELESLLNTDTSVPTSSSMKPSTGFTVSEAHLLQQVLDRFALNRRIESGSISLRLHPAELGELQLDVLVQRSTVQLQVTAQNPQVQELLEQNLPRLREALAQHGFSLDRMEVTLAENSQGELLQQGGDTEGRYPATLSSGSVRADWSQNMDEAIESEIILAESNGFAGLNIHI